MSILKEVELELLEVVAVRVVIDLVRKLDGMQMIFVQSMRARYWVVVDEDLQLGQTLLLVETSEPLVAQRAEVSDR